MLLLQDGWTPLLLACYNGNTEVAEILLMNNADIISDSKVSNKIWINHVIVLCKLLSLCHRYQCYYM